MTTDLDDRLDRAIRAAVDELVTAAPAAAPLDDRSEGRRALLPNRPRRAWMALAVTALVALVAAGVAWVESRGSSAPAVEPTSPLSLPSPTDDGPGTASTEPIDDTAPSGTAPETSPNPAPVGSDASGGTSVWVPAVLPEGWTVWNAGAAARPADGTLVTEQLYGVRDPDSGAFAPGILIKVSDGAATIGEPAGEVGDADVFWVDFGVGTIDGIPEVLTWSDGGVRYELAAVGLDMPAMLAIAQGLAFGPDPFDGAVASSLPADLPLVEEWRRPNGPIDSALFYWVSPPAGPDLDTGAVFPNADPGVVRVHVGATAWPGMLLPPEVSLLGTFRADGMAELVTAWFPNQVVGRMPDGQVAVVQGDATAVQLAAILHGLRHVAPADAIATMRLDEHVLRDLPVQASATFPGTGITASVRGPGAFDAPESEQASWSAAICLEAADAMRCRPAWPTLAPFGPDGHLVATATINGHRYVVGADVAADATTMVVPWADRSGAPGADAPTLRVPLSGVEPLESSVVISGDVRFTLVEVPADVPFVQVGLSDGVHVELRPRSIATFPPF